jgi:hypothetical protein
MDLLLVIWLNLWNPLVAAEGNCAQEVILER